MPPPPDFFARFEVLPLPDVSLFEHAHYAEIKQLLPPEICRLVYDYVCLRRDTGTMLAPDKRVEDAGQLYCDMLTETLLAQKQPAIEQAVGAALWPSYSYVRLHRRGAVLAPHRDREASEIAVTIAIGGDRGWPIASRPTAAICRSRSSRAMPSSMTAGSCRTGATGSTARSRFRRCCST